MLQFLHSEECTVHNHTTNLRYIFLLENAITNLNQDQRSSYPLFPSEWKQQGQSAHMYMFHCSGWWRFVRAWWALTPMSSCSVYINGACLLAQLSNWQSQELILLKEETKKGHSSISTLHYIFGVGDIRNAIWSFWILVGPYDSQLYI